MMMIKLAKLTSSIDPLCCCFCCGQRLDRSWRERHTQRVPAQKRKNNNPRRHHHRVLFSQKMKSDDDELDSITSILPHVQDVVVVNGSKLISRRRLILLLLGLCHDYGSNRRMQDFGMLYIRRPKIPGYVIHIFFPACFARRSSVIVIHVCVHHVHIVFFL